jgi:hypothetical protein
MSKSSREQIEKDERKILFELVENSHENIDTISKHIRSSIGKIGRLM